MASLPLTNVNQSSSAAPLVGASLSLSKFKKQIIMSKKSQIKKHIHKASVMLCLHTLNADQSESARSMQGVWRSSTRQRSKTNLKTTLIG
jgi:hypothetical protein